MSPRSFFDQTFCLRNRRCSTNRRLGLASALAPNCTQYETGCIWMLSLGNDWLIFVVNGDGYIHAELKRPFANGSSADNAAAGVSETNFMK